MPQQQKEISEHAQSLEGIAIFVAMGFLCFIAGYILALFSIKLASHVAYACGTAPFLMALFFVRSLYNEMRKASA